MVDQEVESISPLGLLKLWRDRWGRDDVVPAPYALGAMNERARKFTFAPYWERPALLGVAVLVVCLLWMLAALTPLSIQGQLMYSAILLGAGLWVRRYAGWFALLGLLALSFFMSTRYLSWRLQATLGNELNADFALGFVLWVAELGFVMRLLLGCAQLLAPLRSRGTAVRWMRKCQQGMGWLFALLTFYRPLQRCVFALTPLLFMLTGVAAIQTSPQWFLAYWVPHILLLCYAQERVHQSRQLPLTMEIYEAWLAAVILLKTLRSVVRVQMRRCLQAFGAGGQETPPPEAVPTEWRAVVALVWASVYGLALLVGLWRLRTGGYGGGEFAGVYVVWACWNALLLVAYLAVMEEARQVRARQYRASVCPAMIRFETGRTLRCRTQNFPHTELRLEVPKAVEVVPGAWVRISLFIEEHEYTIPAQIQMQEGLTLVVAIPLQVQGDYRQLGLAALNRGANWRAWLPQQNADQWVPHWVHAGLHRLGTLVLHIATHPGGFPAPQRWLNWVPKWMIRK